MTLDEAIRAIRKRRGESMAAFGSRLGIHHSSVSLYESGKQKPSRTVLLLIHGLAEDVRERTAIEAELGPSLPGDLPIREEAFRVLAREVLDKLEALRGDMSFAGWDRFKNLVFDVARGGRIPLWLIEILSLWKQFKDAPTKNHEFDEDSQLAPGSVRRGSAG